MIEPPQPQERLRKMMSKMKNRFWILFLVIGILVTGCKEESHANEREAITFENDPQVLVEGNEFIPKVRAFRDISAIGIFYRGTAAYEEAVECHGREEECADENGGLKIYPEKQEEYIQDLKRMYANYPRQIRKETVEKLFLEKAQEVISPYVVSENKEPIILDDYNFHEFVETPGHLTIVIDARIVNHTEPNIAIISFGFYRPDISNFTSAMKMRHFVAAPLNLSEDYLEKEVKDLLKNFRIPVEERSRKEQP